jgi:hypothetical protein
MKPVLAYTTQKNYSSIFLMNTDTKILNKILAKKKIIYSWEVKISKTVVQGQPRQKS